MAWVVDQEPDGQLWIHDDEEGRKDVDRYALVYLPEAHYRLNVERLCALIERRAAELFPESYPPRGPDGGGR